MRRMREGTFAEAPFWHVRAGMATATTTPPPLYTLSRRRPELNICQRGLLVRISLLVHTLTTSTWMSTANLNDTTPDTMEKSDSLIKMMAQRPATVLKFQTLMGIVADSKATINEHKEFKAHVD